MFVDNNIDLNAEMNSDSRKSILDALCRRSNSKKIDDLVFYRELCNFVHLPDYINCTKEVMSKICLGILTGLCWKDEQNYTVPLRSIMDKRLSYDERSRLTRPKEFCYICLYYTVQIQHGLLLPFKADDLKEEYIDDLQIYYDETDRQKLRKRGYFSKTSDYEKMLSTQTYGETLKPFQPGDAANLQLLIAKMTKNLFHADNSKDVSGSNLKFLRTLIHLSHDFSNYCDAKSTLQNKFQKCQQSAGTLWNTYLTIENNDSHTKQYTDRIEVLKNVMAKDMLKFEDITWEYLELYKELIKGTLHDVKKHCNPIQSWELRQGYDKWNEIKRKLDIRKAKDYITSCMFKEGAQTKITTYVLDIIYDAVFQWNTSMGLVACMFLEALENGQILTSLFGEEVSNKLDQWVFNSMRQSWGNQANLKKLFKTIDPKEELLKTFGQHWQPKDKARHRLDIDEIIDKMNAGEPKKKATRNLIETQQKTVPFSYGNVDIIYRKKVLRREPGKPKEKIDLMSIRKYNKNSTNDRLKAQEYLQKYKHWDWLRETEKYQIDIRNNETQIDLQIFSESAESQSLGDLEFSERASVSPNSGRHQGIDRQPSFDDVVMNPKKKRKRSEDQ